MSISSKLYTAVQVTSATYRLLMAGVSLFFVVRMAFEWDKPNPSNVRTFQPRKRS